MVLLWLKEDNIMAKSIFFPACDSKLFATSRPSNCGCNTEVNPVRIMTPAAPPYGHTDTVGATAR